MEDWVAMLPTERHSSDMGLLEDPDEKESFLCPPSSSAHLSQGTWVQYIHSQQAEKGHARSDIPAFAGRPTADKRKLCLANRS